MALVMSGVGERDLNTATIKCSVLNCFLQERWRPTGGRKAGKNFRGTAGDVL